MTISVVINADTRRGYLTDEKSSIGDYAPGGQEGSRSSDFLIEGVKNKMDFFRGYKTQCVLYIDKHEEIPDDLLKEMSDLVNSYGNNSKLITKEHNRTRHRWYDYIYIEALKQADGDYVAHFDTDTAAFRTDDCDIVERYIKWLDAGYKYVCYPTSKQPNDDYWASTRFFICKKETLNCEELEKCIDNNYLYANYGRIRYDPFPCVAEHTIGLMVKEGEILYPTREDDKYIIFCWSTYFKGTLKKLINMPVENAINEIVIERGVFGANDCVDKQ
jgi:hypothetical protein